LHVSPGEVVKEFYESAPLSASADLPGAEFTWSPSDYLSCTVCPSPFTSAPLNTVYDVTATVLVNGHTCSADTQVTVLVNPVLYIPNTFTPNHDGINDVFEVSGSCFENMDDFYIGIYNRWGQLVTEGYATNFTWDGHDHNDLAQAGIYTYTLSYLNRNTGKYYNRLGHLQLLR
jgi:gliding motility-associated-like protein